MKQAFDQRWSDNPGLRFTTPSRTWIFPEEEILESPLPPKKQRSKLVFAAVATMVLAALLCWMIYNQIRGQYFQTTNDAYVQAESVTIAPRVSGYVERVFVTDHQAVAEGDPLVLINAKDFEAQTQQYVAQVDVAVAVVAGAKANIDEQRALVVQSRAQLAAADAAARYSWRQAERYQPLAASGAEPEEKYAKLRADAVQGSREAETQRAALVVAQRRIASLEASRAQAEAQSEGARAQLAAAKLNLESTLIRASIEGRIGDKTVRVGQLAQPGTRLMSIVPLRRLYIVANFKETQIGLMRVGQPATVEVDALSGVKIIGSVESISPGTGAEFSILPPQNATGNFTKIVQRVPVRIAVDLGDQARDLLVPGLSVTVSVDTISAKGTREAIEAEQDMQNRWTKPKP